MPSLREVKARIKSTEKTSQITKAMHMVSASKLRKSEKKYQDYKKYMAKIEDLSRNVLYSKEGVTHPLLEKKEITNIVYIIITSDKGLAGAYNNNVLKKLKNEISNNELNIKVAVVGKHGLEYCLKNNFPLVRETSIVVRDDVLFIDLEPLAQQLIQAYLDNKVDKIMVIYNKYVNTLTQEVVVDTFLPFEIEKRDIKENEYVFDSGMERTIDLILPMYLKNKLFGYILNAKTSEHAARMNAMKNATDNAKEVIDKLQILYNRARQDSITKELTDIVSGANSIN